MHFIFETHGFEPEPDLAAFAETTCLFELWAPGRPIEAVRLTLSASDPRQRCFRALLCVEIEGRDALSAGVIGGDLHDVIERVSVVLGGMLSRLVPVPPMMPAPPITPAPRRRPRPGSGWTAAA